MKKAIMIIGLMFMSACATTSDVAELERRFAIAYQKQGKLIKANNSRCNEATDNLSKATIALDKTDGAIDKAIRFVKDIKDTHLRTDLCLRIIRKRMKCIEKNGFDGQKYNAVIIAMGIVKGVMVCYSDKLLETMPFTSAEEINKASCSDIFKYRITR